jgi:hypothetical protein
MLGLKHTEYSQVTVAFVNDSGERAVTYVSRQMRNYALWAKQMEVGASFDGLRLIRYGLIDADSIRDARRVERERQIPKARESELGVFARQTPKPVHERELTHALVYADGRWSCKCGYMLGRDGHSALYALCPLKARDKTKRTRGRRVARAAYREIKISSPPSKAVQQLFELD